MSILALLVAKAGYITLTFILSAYPVVNERMILRELRSSTVHLSETHIVVPLPSAGGVRGGG
jgi:hypothetical protein